jgi:hypothetical protein
MSSLVSVDRRIIYLLVALALSVPLVMGLSVKPLRLPSAQRMYDQIEALESRTDSIVFLVLDYGPNTSAENVPQSEVLIEHLMRRRIKFALFSIYVQAEPFLVSIPDQVAERLAREIPGERWEYGKDWVNLGYRPGGFVTISSIPREQDLVSFFNRDARGNALSSLPAFREVKTLKNIAALAEITSLVGTFETFIQFFQTADYRPVFLHGCTSITIPKAYNYVDSGQVAGLMEGIVGAAAYSALLTERFPGREQDDSVRINTGLGVAQLTVIILILLGNLTYLFERKRRGTR